MSIGEPFRDYIVVHSFTSSIKSHTGTNGTDDTSDEAVLISVTVNQVHVNPPLTKAERAQILLHC